ncbi:MAG: DUF3348 domain-containing protein [Thauera sp.]|nr:DUF3348 domain-containing protein [Thauera sp.]
MAQALPRTQFNSPKLVRVLAGLGVADVSGARQSVAEMLGDWLAFGDALSLYSALNAAPAGGVESRLPAVANADAAKVARAEFERAQGVLAAAITGSGGARAGRSRVEWPAPGPHASLKAAPDYAPYHQYHLAHQRDMTSAVTALRASVRAALSARSPALGRLAALDAVLEQALAPRERALLATVPALLAKRYEQLYAELEAAREDADDAGDAGRWMQPGGWLAKFRGDMQDVLLAELALRLQPVAALIAALDSEVTR